MEHFRRLRVGVALSSGGARGFAHLGVLRALQAAGVNVVALTGSSMGSIMAAGYALHGDAAELERHVRTFQARAHMRRYVPVMDPERIMRLFELISGGARFTDCAVPLAIVATDLERRTPVILTSGSVAEAAFASMAVPFVHQPVRREGRLLVEGSLSCTLPLAQLCRTDVDLIIGSMVSREGSGLGARMADVAMQAACASYRRQRHYGGGFLARRTTASAEGMLPPHTPTLVVTPRLAGIGMFDFQRAGEAIAAGERAATELLGTLAVLVDDAP